jgi:putative flippase GtrA
MFSQFIKFLVVGASNTLVDFLVLNFLIWFFKIYSGWQIIILNSISFSCAVVNSYFLNRYWTFRKVKKKRAAVQFFKFFIISIGGILINSGIVYFGTTFVAAPFNFSSVAWVNIIKIFAVVVSLVWNFAGYKIWVFKDQKSKTT